jgi:hypothetical protein
MEYFLIWLLLCVGAGMFAAYRRNRSGVGFFFLSFFLSPLIGFIFAAILPVKEPPQKDVDHRWANLRCTAPQPRQDRPRVDTASCF